MIKILIRQIATQECIEVEEGTALINPNEHFIASQSGPCGY